MRNPEQRRTRLARLSRVLAALGCISVGLSGEVLHGQGTDRYGDPLPTGVIARLGTTRFRHGSYSVKGLKFLPDSTTLVHASEERSIHFWDAQSGRLLRELRTDPLNIGGFAVSPDGRLMAVAGFWFSDAAAPTQGEIRILDVASGKTIRTLPQDEVDGYDPGLAFTPDGKLLISLGGNGILRMVELASGTEILQQHFPGAAAVSLALSADGSTLAIASGSNTGTLYLWNWQSGDQPRRLNVGGRLSNSQLAFSRDGTQVAACGDGDFRDPIRIWDVERGRLVHQLGLPDRNEYFHGGAVFTPDGKTLLTPGHHRDRSGAIVHSWDATTGEHQGRWNVEGASPLAISPDGRLLAAGTGAGVCVWRWPAREEVLAIDEAHRSSVSRLAVAADGTVVTASDDRTIRVWESATGKQKWKLEHDYWIRDIALSPDGTQLASSSLDDTVRLWDLTTSREIYRLPGHGRLGGTRALGFSADGRSFASFGDDFYLRVWEVRTGKALQERKLQPTGVKVPDDEDRYRRLHIDQARISGDASLLVLGLRKFFAFDVSTGQERQMLDNDGGHIASLAISPDSRYLLAGASGKAVQTVLPDGRTHFSAAKNHPVTLWDLSAGWMIRQIMLPDGGVGPVAFSADGLRFAVATSRPQEKIAIYDTASGVEQRVIDNVPHRVFSLAFAPDGRTLVSGLGDSTALVWDLHGKP